MNGACRPGERLRNQPLDSPVPVPVCVGAMGVSEPDTELRDPRITVGSIEGRPVCGLAAGDYIELTESSRLRLPPGKSPARIRRYGW